MDRAAFDRIARRFAAASPVSRRAAAGMVLAAAAGSSAGPFASAGPAAAKRCVRLGAACAGKTACCAGGSCRKGVCACGGGKSVACGARCLPLVRHGYQPGACDKVPGTTFCADGFCRKFGQLAGVDDAVI